MKTISLAVFVTAFLWYGFMLLVWPELPPVDFTDTGVGCIDDCLEVAE